MAAVQASSTADSSSLRAESGSRMASSPSQRLEIKNECWNKERSGLRYMKIWTQQDSIVEKSLGVVLPKMTMRRVSRARATVRT